MVKKYIYCYCKRDVRWDPIYLQNSYQLNNPPPLLLSQIFSTPKAAWSLLLDNIGNQLCNFIFSSKKKKKKKVFQFHFFFIIIIIIYACVQLQRLQKVFKRTAILNFKLALSHCHGTRKKKKVWDSLMKLISHSMYRFHVYRSHILWEIMRPSHEIPSPPWSESRNCGSTYWVKT